MNFHFQCSDCGEPHHSRLRSPDLAWLAVYMAAVGPVLEQCERTLEWVPVTMADLRPVEEYDGSGSGGWEEAPIDAPMAGSLPRA